MRSRRGVSVTWRRVEETGAGDGNRTHVSSLGSCSSAIELHPLAGRVILRGYPAPRQTPVPRAAPGRRLYPETFLPRLLKRRRRPFSPSASPLGDSRHPHPAWSPRATVRPEL